MVIIVKGGVYCEQTNVSKGQIFQGENA